MAKGRKPRAGGASASPQVSRANKADIRAILGASGSGKTTYVMQQLRQDKPDRLLIWDTKGEFSQEGYAAPVRSISELVAAVRKSEKWKLALIPYGTPNERRKLFDMFAALAFAAGRCTVVAEEISGVAVGGKINAPGWQDIINRGRTYGLTVYALSQRPALMDKETLGNASVIRCGRLAWKADAKIMADCLFIPQDALLQLHDLEFYEREKGTTTHGQIVINP
ncbi:hypothetical protein HNQ50_001398 [Silvimonas terrae]|uniref:Helicase HerA central domain-containing protein n=1 Tax=Silvimonas terrae TaxID=300266 RepID=A0A840RE16_9NEIS|nr:hypothetical protein [Silvimonas terrae]MBB5190676.1 hypothetical protein [Silvimonas terrae]